MPFRVRDSVKPSKVSFLPLRYHSDRANIATNNSQLAVHSFTENRGSAEERPLEDAKRHDTTGAEKVFLYVLLNIHNSYSLTHPR